MAKTQKPTPDLDDLYRVKFQDESGVTAYGTVDRYSKEVGMIPPDSDRFQVMVKDAVRPIMHQVFLKDITPLPHVGYNPRNPGEYDLHVQEAMQADQAAAEQAGGKVVPGAMFKVGVADGYAHYVVTEVKRTRCIVENRDYTGDGYTDHHFGYGGTFPIKEVAEYVRRDHGMKQLFGGHARLTADFHDNQPVGTILHVHYSGGGYFRCEVVEGEYSDSRLGGVMVRGHVLKPVALVGAWRQHDLPSRLRNGTVLHGYHAEKVIQGTTFRASVTSVYEHPDFVKPRGEGEQGDPRTMTPLDLSLPPMTDQEAVEAALWQAVEQAQQALSGKDIPYEHQDPLMFLRAAQGIIDKALKPYGD